MLKLNAILFIILLTSWSLCAKLDELNEEDKDSEIRKDETSSVTELKGTPLRESYRHKHKNKIGARRHGVTKRLAETDSEIGTEKDPECAVLYKNNVPVGILQPFQDSYKFLSVRGDPTFVDIHPLFPKNRPEEDLLNDDDINDENKRKRSNRASFSEENYPSIFTKFRLHNRKGLEKHRTMYKRENNRNQEEVNPVIEDAAVEGKLESLLDDMGLLNDYLNDDIKRDVEDENLEIGTNKINLIKEGKTENRVRRDDPLDVDVAAVLNGIDLPKGNDSTGLDSGSAVLSLNTNDTTITQRSTEDAKVFKRSDESEIDCRGKGSPKVLQYEKRVERDIRDKIKKIKEEVTREIDRIADKEDDAKRQKRQIASTLLEEETKDIDPNFNIEENSKIHIRKKRSTRSNDNRRKTKNKNYNMRSKREVDLSEFDNDEYEAFNENEEVEEMNDGCSCDENDKDCECLKDAESSGIAEEEEYDSPTKYSSKKSVKQFCSCDKDGNHCKCSNNDQSFDYYEDDIESKSIDKKSVKQSCSCDKNGANCKCQNQLVDTTDDHYSDYNSNNEISAFDEEENGSKKRSVKARKYADTKTFQNGEYLLDLQPDLYRIEAVDDSRNKRDNFDDLIEANGAESARRHLIAVKQRSMLPLSRYRRRIFKEETNEEPRKLTNMSEEDLFGALPQSFGGELARYKRVKRSKKKK